MAESTPKTYRNMVIYSIYVRNYQKEGTFKSVEEDLPRIRDLGVDIIWLLPIHPIGEKNRKGTLGSPYSIRDYRSINPEFGSMEDFISLVDSIHALGMKCIIDVVYNHTSHDSLLSIEHPSWFYHTDDGSFGNRIGDWSDIIDLDYAHRELWDYQIETLKMWARYVDGFRCDVAPLVPLDFWKEAKRAVETVRQNTFWLAESVEPVFIRDNRARGLVSHSDSELYQVFDVCYDYDIYDIFLDCVLGKVGLDAYAKAIEQQESIYPDNYVKLRFLENHDRNRAMKLFLTDASLVVWTAFSYFQKGITLVYAGQEFQERERPDLFLHDPVTWSGVNMSELFQRLYQIKQHAIFTDSRYSLEVLPHRVIHAVHKNGEQECHGFFPVDGIPSLIEVFLPDGIYVNIFDASCIQIEQRLMQLKGLPVIIDAPYVTM